MNETDPIKEKLRQVGCDIVDEPDCPPGHIYFNADMSRGEEIAKATGTTYKPRRGGKIVRKQP